MDFKSVSLFIYEKGGSLLAIDYRKYKLNAIESSKDDRDYNIARLVATVNVFPDEFVLPYNHEIKNQGEHSSCTANSLAYCREIKEENQNGVYKKFSVGFLYGNRSDSDYQGEGWTPRDLLKHIQNEGVCEHDLFPYDDDYSVVHQKLLQNKEVLFKNAYQYRISAYARVYTLDEIRNAIMQLKSPVTFIMSICNSFYSITPQNPVYHPLVEFEETLGKHELTIVGWTIYKGVPCLKILNSWGKEWGDNGYFYVSFDDFNSQPTYYSEFWSITDNVVPHPDPVKPQYWRVQVGAFSQKSNAENYASKLKSMGYNTYIVLVNNLFKVQLGAFSVEQNARNLLAKLKANGINCFIVRY